MTTFLIALLIALAILLVIITVLSAIELTFYERDIDDIINALEHQDELTERMEDDLK